MHRSLLIRFLLIFALLLAQMGGLAHGITHVVAEQTQDQSLPHDKLCDLCATYAQIGSALASAGHHLVASENHETLHRTRFTLPASVTFIAYTARAPPHSA